MYYTISKGTGLLISAEQKTKSRAYALDFVYTLPPGCVSIHTQPGVISLSILVCCVFQNLQILSKIIVFDMYVCHPSLPLSVAVTVNQDPLCMLPSVMHPETILCNHPPKQTGCMFRLHNPCSRLLCNIPSSFIPPCISVPAGFCFSGLFPSDKWLE